MAHVSGHTLNILDVRTGIIAEVPACWRGRGVAARNRLAVVALEALEAGCALDVAVALATAAAKVTCVTVVCAAHFEDRLCVYHFSTRVVAKVPVCWRGRGVAARNRLAVLALEA